MVTQCETHDIFLSSGPNCEVNEDDCASNPCEYGDCIDEINGYKCMCHPGYTGMSKVIVITVYKTVREIK